MSWIRDDCVSFLQQFCIKVIKTGRVPKHVAFIMDGNRRYAKKQQINKTIGHSRGFDKFAEALKWCLDLGVCEVTTYAFSIENFKRTPEEVTALMGLAKEKFERLLEEIDQIKGYGVRVHVAGRWSLLPEDLQKAAANVMLATKDNNKLRLNIAYGYTGRDEISQAASRILDGVRNKELKADDVTSELVSLSLDLGSPDLLIRTSGEVRLSDFMLWQISDTMLYFSDVLWPEFSVYHFLAAILHYQRHAPLKRDVNECVNSRVQRFLENSKERRWKQLEDILACS